MLWVNGHHNVFNYFSAMIIFRIDVGFWRLKMVPALKGLIQQGSCHTKYIEGSLNLYQMIFKHKHHLLTWISTHMHWPNCVCRSRMRTLAQHWNIIRQPSKHKAFLSHLYNVGPTSSTLVQHCINVIKMFCVYWEGYHINLVAMVCHHTQGSCKISFCIISKPI